MLRILLLRLTRLTRRAVVKLVWSFAAWNEYLSQDSDSVAKINTFIEDIRRDPTGKGVGKPERLAGTLRG